MIIHKYVIEPTSTYKLSLPLYSDILSVQNQREKLCVWARINYPEEQQREIHTLRVIMTGDEAIENAETLEFIGTVQMAQGSLVLHIFKEGRYRP